MVCSEITPGWILIEDGGISTGVAPLTAVARAEATLDSSTAFVEAARAFGDALTARRNEMRSEERKCAKAFRIAIDPDPPASKSQRSGNAE